VFQELMVPGMYLLVSACMGHSCVNEFQRAWLLQPDDVSVCR
jgi:hypothetical protein